MLCRISKFILLQFDLGRLFIPDLLRSNYVVITIHIMIIWTFNVVITIKPTDR